MVKICKANKLKFLFTLILSWAICGYSIWFSFYSENWQWWSIAADVVLFFAGVVCLLLMFNKISWNEKTLTKTVLLKSTKYDAKDIRMVDFRYFRKDVPKQSRNIYINMKDSSSVILGASMFGKQLEETIISFARSNNIEIKLEN